MLNTFLFTLYILFKQLYVPGMQNSGPDQFYKMYDQYRAETDMAEQALIRQALCQVQTPSLVR